jgi:hypothetical protein
MRGSAGDAAVGLFGLENGALGRSMKSKVTMPKRNTLWSVEE